MQATRALVGDRLSMIEGTHLFPMEQPQLTAQLARAMIHRLLAESSDARRDQHHNFA
jgi:hypothetical protein